MRRFLIGLFCLFLLWPQGAVATDYVTKTATATGNYTFSIDPDLGSSDTTISSQNAVKSYADAHFAPVNGYLLTTQDVATLTNATNLGLLSTGLLKITVSGGIAVVSTAVEGTDYFPAADSQTANYFYAAPNGLDGTPTFRAIVAADLTPSLATIYQPLDADLTYLAGFTPSANVKTILNAANNAAIKTALGYYTSGDAMTGSLTGNASTATALAANGANCTAGNAPLGVDASGAVESCFAVQASSATLTSLAGLTETNGGIPYGTADNAYAWLAAGASGKLLMGAGAAAPVWTTPTFPNAATTTGAYLRADGTNFIQSTLVLPNSGTAFTLAAYTAANTLTELAAVGGTGTVLQGVTGAIPAWSTSTYADTYAKGTVLHAGTANIITGLAPGAVGSFLMSNGTGQALTYLAPGAANYQLVGAGVTTIPVWTASTGTGSPVLSASPTFTGTVTLPKTTEIQDTSADHQYVLAVSELTADRIITLPLLTGADEFVFKDFAQTLTNKTMTSAVLTTPQINDTSSDHQYVFVASELVADRNVTLPLLGAADTFMFLTHHKASSAEINTGTEDNKYVTPDGFAGSNYGKRIVEVKLIDDATALTTGDGKVYFPIPSEMNGWNLVGAHAAVSTVSSSGTPTYQIYNVTQTADMLSTRITIDANENTSYTAAAAPVIDTGNDDVATGDMLRIDKDVAGTGEKGDTIILVFQLP